jgi:transcriptional regulator with XRE-family HTH domain
MPAISKPMANRGEATNQLRRELGDYIRDRRLDQGMTQKQLADAVGMQYYTAISAIEVGRNSVPPERYAAFAKALGISHKGFMRQVLRLTNPWACATLFDGDPERACAELSARFTERVAPISS